MSATILIDGIEQSQIDVRDRGLQYGDGLFETMAVSDGRVRRLNAHLDRLRGGCERLGFACPDSALIEAELLQLAHGQRRAVLKLIVTRGMGGRGYRPPPETKPTRIVSLNAWPEYPAHWWQDGVDVRICHTTLGDNPVLAGLKHLNRLEQVLARNEWNEPQIAEGLMLDARGTVVCGTMSNVFLVSDGILRTPRLDRCGVLGTTRRAVLAEAAALGIAAEETDLRLEDVLKADEVFLTNAVIGLWPVRSLDKRQYSIGPVTRRLQREVS